MKLDNIYVEILENGEKRLFLKKYKVFYSSLGDVNYSVFIDLDTKEEINKLNTNNLISVKKFLNLSNNRMSKRKIKKLIK